jgi:rare lipoprotein A (peptidoglycan hydrolase)
VSTPTRIPENVPVRQVLLAALAAVLLLAVAVPAGADETTASLRAKRQVLVQRIASLADDSERALVRAGDADRRRFMSQAALDVARRRFAANAVNAYIGGVQHTEDKQLRLRAWAGALGSVDEKALGEFRAAKEAADRDGAAAKATAQEAKRVTADLEATRTALEKTIEDRTTYERAKAKPRPVAAVAPARAPGHQRATGTQGELMRRYRFGPGGVPAGLVRSGQVLSGRASWYGPGFDGRATASGAIFDQEGWTVANKTLPLGTILLITANGRSVVVLVNDRGPYVAGRIIDLSHGVAVALGTIHAGVAPVRAEILIPS